MNKTACLLIVMSLCVLCCGCGTSPRGYNNEYLTSAKELEKGLRNQPNAVNREQIKKRIDHLMQLHEMMIEQEDEGKQQ